MHNKRGTSAVTHNKCVLYDDTTYVFFWRRNLFVFFQFTVLDIFGLMQLILQSDLYGGKYGIYFFVIL